MQGVLDYVRVIIASIVFTFFVRIWSIGFLPLVNWLQLWKILPFWVFSLFSILAYTIVLVVISRWYFRSVPPNIKTGSAFGFTLFIGSVIIFEIYNVFTKAFFAVIWSGGSANLFVLIMFVTLATALILQRNKR